MKYYENYVEFNLSTDKSCRTIFDGDLDVDNIIGAMRLFNPGTDIVAGRTLIFLDEIQEYPRAKEALKSFTIDGRYDVISSGSMLGVDLPRNRGDEEYPNAEQGAEPMEPTGYVEYLTMYALDFEEFCWANGTSEEIIHVVRECINRRLRLEPAFLDRFKTIFRDFMLVGGMPEAVQSFVDEKDYSKVGKIQRDILESCRKDIIRYNTGADRMKTLDCFESIPAQLSESNKKYTFSRIDNGKSRNSATKYKDNLFWIEGAGYGILVRSLTEISKPLRGHEVRDQFKVYLSDTGMLMEMYGSASKQSLYSGDLSFNKGAITENVVAECIRKTGRMPRYYRKNNGPSMMDIDFVIELGNEIAAIEVKSGKNREAPSISKVGRFFNVDRRIMLEESNIYVSEDGIEHYPLFAAGFIGEMESKDPACPEFRSRTLGHPLRRGMRDRATVHRTCVPIQPRQKADRDNSSDRFATVPAHTMESWGLGPLFRFRFQCERLYRTKATIATARITMMAMTT
ncbi:MAG: ATP-binding protein [Candidatus Methanomethylophilaceae archaeon]|nr:ATP-binding protein [Candidatus Methanomethylophilaceae archaeon]